MPVALAGTYMICSIAHPGPARSAPVLTNSGKGWKIHRTKHEVVDRSTAQTHPGPLHALSFDWALDGNYTTPNFTPGSIRLWLSRPFNSENFSFERHALLSEADVPFSLQYTA